MGGCIVFPWTTCLSTVIVEVYGYKNSRQAIWSGIILNLTFLFFIDVVYILPSSTYWHFQGAYKEILLPNNRVICASLISYFISDFINSYLMSTLKVKNDARLLKRMAISYLCSTFIDITLFMTLAFLFAMPFPVFLKLACAAYLKKIFAQFLLLPLTWYLIAFLKRKESIEVYDYETNFNPFSLENTYSINSYKKQKTQ